MISQWCDSVKSIKVVRAIRADLRNSRPNSSHSTFLCRLHVHHSFLCSLSTTVEPRFHTHIYPVFCSPPNKSNYFVTLLVKC